MARLPTPGGDAGNWGVILNEYLRQAHDETGRLKDTGVLATKYSKPIRGIPASDLEAGVQDVLDTVADHSTALAQQATTLSDHTSTLAQHTTDLTAKASQSDLSAVSTRIDGSLKADGTLKHQSVTRAALDASVAGMITTGKSMLRHPERLARWRSKLNTARYRQATIVELGDSISEGGTQTMSW